MAITMQDSISMEFRKGMESIIGQMAVFTKATSAMEPDMGMAFGKVKTKHISAYIEWIRSKVLECIHGRIKKCTKASSAMITVRVMDRCIA